jgi:hypothetical protein
MSKYEEDDSNQVYYKIKFSTIDQNYYIPCLQWFDEIGDDDSDTLKDANGNPYIFYAREDGERKAKEFLNKVIKPEYIDPKYLIANNENMYKIPQDQWDED